LVIEADFHGEEGINSSRIPLADPLQLLPDGDAPMLPGIEAVALPVDIDAERERVSELLEVN
jgi:hypothetical protein